MLSDSKDADPDNLYGSPLGDDWMELFHPAGMVLEQDKSLPVQRFDLQRPRGHHPMEFDFTIATTPPDQSDQDVCSKWFPEGRGSRARRSALRIFSERKVKIDVNASTAQVDVLTVVDHAHLVCRLLYRRDGRPISWFKEGKLYSEFFKTSTLRSLRDEHKYQGESRRSEIIVEPLDEIFNRPTDHTNVTTAAVRQVALSVDDVEAARLRASTNADEVVPRSSKRKRKPSSKMFYVAPKQPRQFPQFSPSATAPGLGDSEGGVRQDTVYLHRNPHLTEPEFCAMFCCDPKALEDNTERIKLAGIGQPVPFKSLYEIIKRMVSTPRLAVKLAMSIEELVLAYVLRLRIREFNDTVNAVERHLGPNAHPGAECPSIEKLHRVIQLQCPCIPRSQTRRLPINEGITVIVVREAQARHYLKLVQNLVKWGELAQKFPSARLLSACKSIDEERKRCTEEVPSTLAKTAPFSAFAKSGNGHDHLVLTTYESFDRDFATFAKGERGKHSIEVAICGSEYDLPPNIKDYIHNQPSLAVQFVGK